MKKKNGFFITTIVLGVISLVVLIGGFVCGNIFVDNAMQSAQNFSDIAVVAIEASISSLAFVYVLLALLFIWIVFLSVYCIKLIRDKKKMNIAKAEK